MVVGVIMKQEINYVIMIGKYLKIPCNVKKLYGLNLLNVNLKVLPKQP